MIRDITGKKFNRLTVKNYYGHNKYSQIMYLCVCDCGNERILEKSRIKNGRVKSCGCLRLEVMSKIAKKHGMRHTKIYYVWCSMKQRCNDKNYTGYKNWGGRGIHYDKSWEKFENFYKDFGYMYKEGLSIDRIDNDKGYSKENCRWADSFTQANNVRSNLRITFNDKTQNLKQWTRELGIPYLKTWLRIYRYKWPIDRAFNCK